MPSKSFGETLIRGAARIAEPLSRHELAKRVARGDEDATRANERQGKTDVMRPDGTLVWFHVQDLAGALTLIGTVTQLREDLPELQVLFTTQEMVRDFVFALRMPANALHQYAPLDNPAAVERFLEHWKPDLAVWSCDVLMPVMNTEVSNRGIPSFLVNIRDVDKANPQFRWFPSIGKPALRSFDVVLAATEDAATMVRGFGAVPEIMGELQEEAAALPHDETRRSHVSRMLQGRPVWLAAQVVTEELDAVIEAHSAAARITHRLLLVLVPEDPADVVRAQQLCEARNLVWKDSHDLQDLPARVDVVVAEGADGLGLWYQLAAVCFLGGSLEARGGHTPLEAAGLGSAIIHGPHVDNYADIYLRMRDAGAAIEVNSAASLSEAVGELVVPDRAAEMAHAGWSVCSEGADATDALVERIWEFMPMGSPA